MLESIKRRALSVGAGITAYFWSVAAFAEYGLNLKPGVTPISHEAYDLHMLILWICVAIAVVVFGAMLISVIFHRKSRGAVASQFHESTAVEMIWTVVPFVILVAMAIPATKALIIMEDTSDSDISIKVTGYQWKWGYEYMGEGVSFISALDPKHFEARERDSGIDVTTIDNYLLEVDNPIVVPVNKKVRLLVTSNDVIHAWWVPELGMKKDAVPGYINEMWFNVEKEGTYRGQCTELCGKDHGYMPIVVIAKSEADYASWLTEQKAAGAADAAAGDRDWSLAELMERGEKAYGSSCAACHQANGAGIPGAFPALKDSPVAMGAIGDHLALVMNGVPGTAMGGFASQLSDVDMAAIVTYERNAWGNNVGDMVQPSEVKAAR